MKEISVKVCTYDNPVSMRRECWSDGEIIWSCCFTALFRDPFPIPHEKFFFGANVGEWKEGQLIGDVTAVADEKLSGACCPI